MVMKVVFDRLGRNLPKQKQYTAQQMITPKPGELRVFPVGTDTRAPGSANGLRQR